MDTLQHNKNIIEQFSKQAAAYTSLPAHSNALELLTKIAAVSNSDEVLDLACGSGLVSCEFAKHAKHVTGIDITAEMIEQAKLLQSKMKLQNINWKVENVQPLSFQDDSFSIVVTRFSFHHFIDPQQVLAEMIRVCKPNGHVMVVDVALPEEKVDAYNVMETLRDRSHSKALSTDEFDSLFRTSGLSNIKIAYYLMEIELESQLAASFPEPGDKEKLKNLILADIGIDNLGVNARSENGKVMLTYPIYIYTGFKK